MAGSGSNDHDNRPPGMPSQELEEDDGDGEEGFSTGEAVAGGSSALARSGSSSRSLGSQAAPPSASGRNSRPPAALSGLARGGRGASSGRSRTTATASPQVTPTGATTKKTRPKVWQ